MRVVGRIFPNSSGSPHIKCAGSEAAPGSDLQRRVDAVLATARGSTQGPDEDLNMLMFALLEDHETAAFIRFAGGTPCVPFRHT